MNVKTNLKAGQTITGSFDHNHIAVAYLPALTTSSNNVFTALTSNSGNGVGNGNSNVVGNAVA
jgi:hypothetical protein